MKTVISCSLLGCLLLTACSKNSTTPTPGSSTRHQPNAILTNWQYNGSRWERNGFMLLDLAHTDNKDKAYMVITATQTGGSSFSFQLKEGPKPIDSLAANWPANVQQVGFGYSNDMVVNAAMRLQAETFSRPYTFRYDSIHHFSTAIYTWNYLNNPLYAGSMAGKAPQGRASGWSLDAAGNAIPRDVIYYFRESAYSNVSVPGNGGILLTDLAAGVETPSAFWQNVDAVLTIEGNVYTHLYFDFDNWQYFSVYDWCPSIYGAPCTKGGVQVISWKSMDELMTWPEGWGKR